MGIYIHIPFCKQACHYCNFHFSTATKYQAEMVEAILKELHIRKDYLSDKSIKSIYFGGGTPSILSQKQLGKIMDAIRLLFKVTEDAEITLEANPDDIQKSKLLALKDIGVNRLSLGVQSFHQADLALMNRSHSPAEAKKALNLIFEEGFKEVNLDLIYGIPTASNQDWVENMELAFSFPINHLSAYALTVESKTALAHFISKGKYPPIDEQKASGQYDRLIEFAKEKGWEHYEISNFSLPGKEALHNTAYWQGKPYLGVGPAAHSFDGAYTRQWNVANNQTYMRELGKGEVPAEIEKLDLSTRYNEYVMTGLRTKKGCSIAQIEQYGEEYVRVFRKEILFSIKEGLVIEENNVFVLTQKGMHFADRLASDLMVV